MKKTKISTQKKPKLNKKQDDKKNYLKYKPKLDLKEYGSIFCNSIISSKAIKKNCLNPKSPMKSHKNKDLNTNRFVEYEQVKSSPDKYTLHNKLKKKKSSKTRVSINSSLSNQQHNHNLSNQFINVSGNIKEDDMQFSSSRNDKKEDLSSSLFKKNEILKDFKEEEEVYFAEQPDRIEYGTQRIIENFEYDNEYKINTGAQIKKKKSLKVNKSFKSDDESGFLNNTGNVFIDDSEKDYESGLENKK